MNADNLLFVKFENIKVPEFKEVRGKEWISFGADNLYPDYLISLYERSATHNAIVNGKVQYIMGEGVTYAHKGISTITKANIQQFIENINGEEDIEDLLNKVVLDFEIFNGFYLEIIKSKSGRDFTVNHIPFSKIRTNSDMSRFYYSNDWQWEKGTQPEKTGYKEYPAFNADAKAASSIYYFKILSPKAGKSPNVYPIPSYIGGTQAIETEIHCSNFNLSEVKTGFSAGKMINFYNGIPSPDEQAIIKKKIKNELEGAEGAKWILNFADSKERGSEVLTLTGDDLPDRYMNVKNSAMRTIFTAHRVSSPALFGVQQENVTFGTRAEIAEQYEVFQNTYISGRQRSIEKVFNEFAKLKGINPKIKMKPTKAINTDVFSEATIVANIPRAALQEIIAERMGIDLSRYNFTSQQTEQDFEVNFLDNIQGFSKQGFRVLKSMPVAFDADFESVEMSFEEQVLPTSPTNTPPPSKVLKDVPADIRPQTEIVYSYEWRPEFSNADKSTMRDFCKELIKRDLFYTKDEIQRMRNEFNSSVWKYKGGWMTQPDGSHKPYCRHWWVANLIIKE